MVEKANPVLKSVPNARDFDSVALKRIVEAHQLKCEAQSELETAETKWANAKKAMLDETTETKNNLFECIDNAEKARGKESTKHLNAIVDARHEHDETVEKHTIIVAVAADEKKKAAKKLVSREAELTDAIVNSKQESLNFDD